MPEAPMPGVNGHVPGSPAAQVSMSMLSLEPAARMLGWFASTATAGSFCLFCENGPVGLPTVTSESWAKAGAAAARAATRTAAAARDLGLGALLVTGDGEGERGAGVPGGRRSQASPARGASDRRGAYLAPPRERRRPVLLSSRMACGAAPAGVAAVRAGRPRGACG